MRQSNVTKQGLGRDAELDFREVDLGLGDCVEVVGENTQGDVGDDFTDFSLRESRIFRRLNIRVGNFAARLDQGASKIKRGIGLRIE
jgi:hypothetical protein